MTDPPSAGIAAHPLDAPVRAALLGPHRRLGAVRGRAARYLPDVCPFAASTAGPLPPGPDDGFWADLAVLLDGATAILPGPAATPPDDWEVTMDLPGVQMVAGDGRPGPGDPTGIDVLGPDDTDEMLALVARARPGPFGPRTPEMGVYLGIRDGRAADAPLVALAGERLRLPGFVEISAVCTDPDHRGRGHASRLVRAVAAGIRARGDVPFLHATATNTPAIALYERLGFVLRARPSFLGVRAPVPGHPPAEPDPARPHEGAPA